MINGKLEQNEPVANLLRKIGMKQSLDNKSTILETITISISKLMEKETP